MNPVGCTRHPTYGLFLLYRKQAATAKRRFAPVCSQADKHRWAFRASKRSHCLHERTGGIHAAVHEPLFDRIGPASIKNALARQMQHGLRLCQFALPSSRCCVWAVNWGFLQQRRAGIPLHIAHTLLVVGVSAVWRAAREYGERVSLLQQICRQVATYKSCAACEEDVHTIVVNTVEKSSVNSLSKVCPSALKAVISAKMFATLL